MKVDQLGRLLDSLVNGLEGVVAAPVNKDLTSFVKAMQPFGSASVSEFSTFLGQFGSEFQKTGKITPQGKLSFSNNAATTAKTNGSERVIAAVRAIKDLFAEIDRGSVDDHRLEQVLRPIAILTVPQLHQVLADLEIAEKPRAKAKIVEKIRQVVHHQMESHARAASAGKSTIPSEPLKAAS